MSRKTRSDALTGDLFTAIPKAAPASPGSMDFRSQVAAIITRMLAEALARDPYMDRYAVAAAASRYAGKEISKAMLDGYTAGSRKAFNLPLWVVPALEFACQSTLLTEWLAEVRGGRLILGPEALQYEASRLRTAELQLAKRRRELEDLSRRLR